jgi:phage gpG-like protein
MAEIAIFDEGTSEAAEWLKQLRKKVGESAEAKGRWVSLMNVVVFGDIISHFEKEEGSEGPWKEWSSIYREHMERIGRADNQILQFSGNLRQNFTKSSYRSVSHGIEWFNPAKTKSGFPYAAAHDDGGDRLPKRDFMWLSPDGFDRVMENTLAFILDEKS